MARSIDELLRGIVWMVRTQGKDGPALYGAMVDGSRFLLDVSTMEARAVRYKSEAEKLRADRRFIAGATVGDREASRSCPGCLQSFFPTRKGHVYCSPACKVRVSRTKKRVAGSKLGFP